MNIKPLFTILFVLTISALLLNSCDDKPNCKLGKPTAIFPDNVPSVTNRTFNEKDNVSTENIEFNNGVKLEILQDGCDYVRQEFRFELNEASDSTSALYWTNKAASLFHFMADQTDQLQDFHLWAGAIEMVAPNLRLGERTPLDGPFTIKVDKINMGDNQALLMVVLSNEPL